MYEPDFTNPYPSEDFEPKSKSALPRPKREQRRNSYDEDEFVPHPGYTMDDMNPTARDPLCSSNRADLACFWPVYVGNFKATARAEVDKKVKLYFASRGLHVRWCFQRIDAYYQEFQREAGLYDMLVYFVSERDAKFAIERCHRDTFCGYTLNVFPGREPVYFDPNRSVYAEKMKSGRIFSEHFFEKHVKRFGVVVDCVVKFDMQNGALQFARPGDVTRAQKMERMWTYLPVTGKMQKQRFLERDLIKEIENHLARYPGTLQPQDGDKYMRMLLQGKLPFVDPNKSHQVVPLRRGPGKRAQLRKFKKKQERMIKFGFNTKRK